MINTTIGKYKITRLIGEGGMASVYEAEHEMLGTKVAIKVLNPILSANAQIKERFRNEAKLMASLDHPNITRVIDFDEQPQQLSIVMEFLNGEDLNQKIKGKGALNEKEITNLFSQTLSAFQYAHEKGIVHRDIKPSNIFILPNGHVKILDFGIAKLFGQGNEMTQTGTQMGTPIYMSPEQVKADKSIDHRSDIYSLGVTLYYVVNGKPPYNSDTESQFEIFNKIVFEPLPKFLIQSKFREVVIKACQKNREERFQTCSDYLRAFNLSSINPMESNEKTIIDVKMADNTKHEKAKAENLRKNDKEKEPSKNHELSENKNAPVKTNKKTLNYLFIFIGLIGLLFLIYQLRFNSNASSTQNKSSNQDESSNLDEVTIGSQVWTSTNLDVSTFRNGDPIPEAKTDEEWAAAGENGEPAWCYYDNDPSNGTKYGKLYNWHAVNDPRGLAPNGYHIPTDAEWTILTDYLGGEDIAGTSMKNASGWEENGNGTNSSGFSGRPSGFRGSDGAFIFIGNLGNWWSSSGNLTYDAWDRLPGLRQW